MNTATNQPSTWSPLRRPVFRGLWIASLASMIALVQAATNLPDFVLALPSGALADIVDRWLDVVTPTLPPYHKDGTPLVQFRGRTSR